MANFPLLRKPDDLPAVGVLQKLLNRGGAALKVGGHFGPKTERAVVEFQRRRHLKRDGIVGKDTWARLAAEADLPIMDCIDIFDPSLMENEMLDIRKVGGNPLVLGGMCNGVEQAVRMIQAASTGHVFLLRFHGHGLPGLAAISHGEGELDPNWDERADLDYQNLAVMLPIFARLRGIFGPYGCLQFMHCQTGSGHRGRAFLRHIADHLGVPVSAGIRDQLAGGNDTFRFEGPTFTAVPRGQSIAAWASKLPDFAEMSVP